MAVVLRGSPRRTTTIPSFPRFLASNISLGEGRGVPQRLSFLDASPRSDLRDEGV